MLIDTPLVTVPLTHFAVLVPMGPAAGETGLHGKNAGNCGTGEQLMGPALGRLPAAQPPCHRAPASAAA